MKTIAFLLVIACLGCADKAPAPEKDSGIRYNGLYATGQLANESTGDGYRSFLKFYEDGTVISGSVNGKPEEVLEAGWFKKGHSLVGSGEYTVEDDRLQFTSESATGSVRYSGTVTGTGKLKLRSKSASNGNEENLVYAFYEE